MEENIAENQDQSGTQETSEQTSEGQSEATGEEGLYELPDGRKVDASTLSKEWKENFYPEFTRRSQKLADYERARAEREAKVQQEAAEAVSKNELLQDVDPNVSEAIKQIVTPVIQDALRQKDEAAAQEARDRELRQSFDNAEKKYDGKDGYPKFNRNAITQYMLDNEVYDPERAYLLMNQSSIIDAEVRKAMKGGRKSTESTTGSGPQKPQGSPPKSWEEASKRAVQR